MELFLLFTALALVAGKGVHSYRCKRRFEAELAYKGLKPVYIGSGILRVYYCAPLTKEQHNDK